MKLTALSRLKRQESCLPKSKTQLSQNIPRAFSLRNKLFCFPLLLFLFSTSSWFLFCCIMEKPKVIGPNGLAPITLDRQADICITTKVIYDVISNCDMISLEESIHAPAAVRKQARADRLAGVQTVSARLKAHRSTQLEMDSPPKLCDASKDIEKAMKLNRVCHSSPHPRPIHTSIFPTICSCASLFDSLPFLFINPFNSNHPRD